MSKSGDLSCELLVPVWRGRFLPPSAPDPLQDSAGK